MRSPIITGFDKNGALRERFRKTAKVKSDEMEFESGLFIGQISAIVSEIPGSGSTAKRRKRAREQFVSAVKKAAAYGGSLSRLAVLEFANEDPKEVRILTREILQLEVLAKKLSAPTSNIELQSAKSLAAAAVLRVFAIFKLPTPDTRGSFAELCLTEVLRFAHPGDSGDDTSDSHRDLLRSARKVLIGQK